MKTHSVLIYDAARRERRKQSPTARLLQIFSTIHESKLKDDGIQVLSVSILPEPEMGRDVRLQLQTDASPEAAEAQICEALDKLGFMPHYSGQRPAAML